MVSIKRLGSVWYPTGEFWLNNPTHDKQTACLMQLLLHIFMEKESLSRAFTTLRMDWTHIRGSLKAWRQKFCNGINRMVFHVNTLNPMVR